MGVMNFIQDNGIDPKQVVLGKHLHLPAYGEDSVISSVFFVTGKRGSGKSWTTAVMMEEFNRLGLQFVCFDVLDAHGNLPDLEGVEGLKPAIGQSVDMKALVKRLGETNKSLVVKLAGLPLLSKNVRILSPKWADQFLLTLSCVCANWAEPWVMVLLW
jgi:hypothetical protein